MEILSIIASAKFQLTWSWQTLQTRKMLIKSLQLTFKQVKKLLKPDPATQDTLMDYQF
jgi:hypothetical protein